MEDLIARVVEIEKQCAEAISNAEKNSKEKITAHARVLEERKASEFATITTETREKLTRSIEEARKRIEAETEAVRRSHERIDLDPTLRETIKQKIVSILLST